MKKTSNMQADKMLTKETSHAVKLCLSTTHLQQKIHFGGIKSSLATNLICEAVKYPYFMSF